MSLKVLPERVQKVIAIEIHRISDLILAHQDSYRPTKESENADRVGESIEAMKKGQAEIQRGIATCSELLRAQRERINSALAANDRVLKRLAAYRIILGLAFSYLAGILTVLAFQHLLFVTLIGPRP
jgi:septation ring formation regulator EzrA